MFINDYLFIKKSDSQNDFKNNVFQHIVSETENFDLKKLPELLELIEKLSYEHNKDYRIEYDGKIFEFVALDVPEKI